MDQREGLLVMGDGPGAAELLEEAAAGAIAAGLVVPREVAGGGDRPPGWPWPFASASPPSPAVAGTGVARAFLAGGGAVFIEGPGGLAQARPRRIVLAPRLRPARPSWWRGPAIVAAPVAGLGSRRVMVVGGGHTGVEAAAGWLAAGHQVLLVEAADRLLPSWDADLAAVARAALEERGAVVLAGVRAVGCEAGGDGARVVLRAGAGIPDRTEEVDLALPALGWRPVLAGCGLERTRALVDRHGFLEADSRCQTSEPAMHAIAGALALPLSAAAARSQARIVARVAGGDEPPPLRHAQIPRVVSGPVPLLAAGLSVAAAGARGFRAAGGRAEAEDGTWVRCVADVETGSLLGVQAAGPGAAALAGDVAGLLDPGGVTRGGPGRAERDLSPLLAAACAAGGCGKVRHV